MSSQTYLLLIDTQFLKICKAFTNRSSANINIYYICLFIIYIYYICLLIFINLLITNKAEDLSNKVACNDLVKTACVSKNLIIDFKKASGTGNKKCESN